MHNAKELYIRIICQNRGNLNMEEQKYQGTVPRQPDDSTATTEASKPPTAESTLGAEGCGLPADSLDDNKARNCASN